MFAWITQVQSCYSLYSIWTRLKWLKITQVLFGKLQTTVVQHQTWELTWAKWQIWNHYALHEKIENLLEFSTRFWSPLFCNCPFWDRGCCKTSICRSCCKKSQPYEALCFRLPSLHFLHWGTVFLALVKEMVTGFYLSPPLPCLSNL